MFKHHLNISIRSLTKQKGYTLINLIGLTTGMACAIFILIFVMDELSYDKYHSKADRIARICGKGMLNDNEFDFAVVGAPTGGALIQDFPEVEDAVRFRDRGSFIVSKGDQHFKEQSIIYVDSNLFDIFDFEMVEGDPKKALTAPNSMILSEEMAKKYFGDENPIGQILKMDHEADYQVTGVFAEIPHNSHFRFDIFLSMSTLEESRMPFWTNFNYQTYVLLKEGTQLEALDAKIPQMVEKYIGPEIEQYLGATMEQFEEMGNHLGYYFQPLTDIHLHSDIGDELGANGDMSYVYIFSAIGFFLLLIACINFMNLATAKSSKRAREVGIKKVVGAVRSQLIGQFLSESLLLSIISTLLSLGIVALLLSSFNQLAAKEMSMAVLGRWEIIGAIMFITILVGMMAGSYPAFYLSAFRPVSVLKGELSRGAKSGWLRSGLVVVQFCITAVLIVGSIVVSKQLSYIQNKKLGFDKERLLVINDTYVLGERVDAFKEEMLRDPRITHASITGFIPVGGNNNSTSFWEGKHPTAEKTQVISNWRVDHDYIPTMGMEIVEGRNFDRAFSTDSVAIVVNEATSRFYGWEDPIGQELSTHTGEEDEITTYKVIGVVKDFHFESLRANIVPLLLYLGNNRSKTTFRIQHDNMTEVLAEAEKKWEEFAPGQPFDYAFMDERFDRIYRAEQRFGNIFSIFAGIAILVACLGLFGLAAYMAEQRTREIGIRKILGASPRQVVVLLSREFALLIAIAFIIAIPLAWYAMNNWLQGFEYRTEIGISTFLWAALAVFTIAALTVSSQAVKASLVNPADSLRYE